MNIISEFLSSKWNLWGICALCYLLIGFVLESVGMSFAQLFLIFFLMAIVNGMVYIYGIGRGMMLSAMSRPKFIQELDKLNELMRRENKKASNKKCNKKKTKSKGCSSDGCKNC